MRFWQLYARGGASPPLGELVLSLSKEIEGGAVTGQKMTMVYNNRIRATNQIRYRILLGLDRQIQAQSGDLTHLSSHKDTGTVWRPVPGIRREPKYLISNISLLRPA